MTPIEKSQWETVVKHFYIRHCLTKFIYIDIRNRLVDLKLGKLSHIVWPASVGIDRDPEELVKILERKLKS